MSFELDSLFNLDDFEESLNLSIIPNLVDRDNNLDTKQTDEEKNDTAHEDDPLEEVHFDVLITTTLQDENQNLISEMKEWKSKAEEHAKANNRFHQRLTGTYQAQTGIPAELITRLNKLERENQHLCAEITELKERVGEVGRENMVLCEENTGKSRKLKGANKKVKNAKDVAVREEAKAKGAVHEKTQRQLAERKMKLERNEALAELQKYKKMSEDLGAELKIERAGRPHLREDGVEEDYTTVVVPVESKIYRGDFRKLAMILDSNQMKIVDGFKRWYKEWKKPKDEEVKVVGADYVDEKRKKFKIGVDISDDTNGFQQESRIPETGAEHDGWRSKRGLEAICRQAQAGANSSY